ALLRFCLRSFPARMSPLRFLHRSGEAAAILEPESFHADPAWQRSPGGHSALEPAQSDLTPQPPGSTLLARCHSIRSLRFLIQSASASPGSVAAPVRRSRAHIPVLASTAVALTTHRPYARMASTNEVHTTRASPARRTKVRVGK